MQTAPPTSDISLRLEQSGLGLVGGHFYRGGSEGAAAIPLGVVAEANLIRFPALQPGDILLYGGRDLIGWLIELRTWSDVSHVEVYAGSGRVMASRSEGPREYPLGVVGLKRVIRPVAPFDFALGRKWFDQTARHLPYGYIDLARFYKLDFNTRGLICSEFADLFFRKCGLPLFNMHYPAGAVCPRDFETLSPLLAVEIWHCVKR